MNSPAAAVTRDTSPLSLLASVFDVKPAEREAEDDPPNWELITPGGVVLEFGPGVRWRIGSVDSRASWS